ncbi:hypothetical protein J2805_001619 [Arthrobacter oryzae]|nr:hypothetical protein [Arthrobacter oryzae]
MTPLLVSAVNVFPVRSLSMGSSLTATWATAPAPAPSRNADSAGW